MQQLRDFMQHLIDNELANGDGVHIAPALEKLLKQFNDGEIVTPEQLAEDVFDVYFAKRLHDAGTRDFHKETHGRYE